MTAGLPELAPETRERLAQATGDSRLAPWQRDLMLRLARTGAGSTPGPSAADPSAARSTLASLASDDTDGAWNQPLGPGLGGHSAIYDPVRDRMVVFGGVTGPYNNDVWVLSLAGTPAWTRLTPAGTPPSGRSGHSAIYDPVRDRMVVFGGYSGSRLDDVWALSLADTPAWTELTPSGTPPSGRTNHSAIYDPVRDRMVVFGGYSDSRLNDVWVLSLADTPAWTELTPSGTPPSARWGHSAIYDPLRKLMLVFGGSSDPFLNDVWVLSLAYTPAWTQWTPLGTPPSARYVHSAIYDAARGRMVVFGGVNAPNDVWALSLTLTGVPTWTELTPSGIPPSARTYHSAIYDPVRDRMVVFGGSDGSALGYYNDVWVLSLADPPAWTELTPSGAPPGARFSHSAIYDPVRDRMVVFGGYSGSRLNDVWALSLADTPAWTELIPSGTPPSARSDHSAIYDPVRDRMVVFGGCSDSPLSPLNDVWALSLADTPAWTELTPSGTPPSPRSYQSAIYDPVRDRMVIFGGYDGLPLGDVWALSLAGTPAWTQLTPLGTRPGPRAGHSAIYDPVRDRMMVFGGISYVFDCNDVWALSWSSIAAVDDPGVQPLVIGLGPPAPNPTRGATTVSYTLAQAGGVQLGVYDVSGRLVHRLVDGERRAGTETVVWSGTDESGGKLGAGVYFVRLVAPGVRETRRVILLR